ncbi:MAG: hypothetical protein EXS15_00550 [Phycisphaerales bacterium]|nr:hypothetical protein [Phycisphaerales bacterium]
MARTPPFAQPIMLVIALFVVLGVLPTRWIAPLGSDLSSILWVPLTPIAHGGTAIRLWLRPRVDAENEADRALATDRDYFRGLWHAEQIRVAELQRKLRAYEVVIGESPRGTVLRLASASVVGRVPSQGGDALRLNIGSQQGVMAGDVALVDGDGVVGRIAPEVGAITCTVIAAGNRAIGRIDAFVVPADQERSSRPQVISIQVVPDGQGYLRGDVELDSAARPGDLVRIKDSTWPIGAQGMRLGVVTEIRRKESQPLRGEVLIRPAVDPAGVGEVVIKLTPGQGS